jgi:hypothetical protein
LFDKLQANKASTVEQVLVEVVQIIAGHRGNCKRFYRLSGHCVLVLAMKKWTHHNNHQAIQRLCFCAVLHMAFQLPMKRTVFFEMGTMECIVKIMKNTTTTNSSSNSKQAVDLHTYGLGALSNLFSAQVIPASQKAATLFVHDLNGLALIVNSMSQFHRESEEIQQLGCLLLMNLSKHGNFKDYMLDADVLCAVSSAKTLYKDNEKINKWGSACCHYLFDG